jgi:DNA (cytosine-5)-methyltransferase 1
MRGLFDDNPNWTERELAYPNRMIRLGSLFSGIGAIEHALKRLNIRTEIQFASDIEPNCKKSYFANYEITEDRWCSDVHELDAKPYRYKVDLLVGGAPCQAFSLVGKRRGFDDTRGTLFREFARVVKECQPKVFIFENVRGMLNHNKGVTWDVIKKTFEDDLHYDIHFQILNSRNYGIPQNRERLFCIGFRKRTEFFFPDVINLEYRMYDFLEDTIDSKYFLNDKGIKFVTSHKNREKRYTQINGEIALCQKRNQEYNWHGDFVYHPLAQGEEEYDEFIFDVNDVEEKYYLSEKVKKYVLCPGTTILNQSLNPIRRKHSRGVNFLILPLWVT